MVEKLELTRVYDKIKKREMELKNKKVVHNYQK